MDKYVYRIDTELGLKKIQDDHFRARRWLCESSYPHKLLREQQSTLPASAGLYLICFFSSHARAEHSLGNFSYLGPRYILRCPKKSVLNVGFSESWDDGFNEGDAYLFWRQETVTNGNNNFSSVGIPLDLFEILNQGKWQPLCTFLGEITSSQNGVSAPILASSNTDKTRAKKSWWKFWIPLNS